jgi:hypothetical protein
VVIVAVALKLAHNGKLRLALDRTDAHATPRLAVVAR